MKRVYTLFIAIIAIITAGGLYMKAGIRAGSQIFLGDVETNGGDEDMNARIEYEHMLLNDPATGKIPYHMRQRELAFAASLPKDADVAFGRTTSGTTWQPRGPWNVGGRTRAFGIDATNENVLIAGSTSGGMWRSTDGGLTWTTTTPVNQYQSVSCVAQDTRHGHANVWYYGTGEYYGASAQAYGADYYGNGIYKSVDSGKTWTVLSATTSTKLTSFDVWGDFIWDIVINTADTVNDILYAAAYGGIYKSTDGGTSWNLVKGTFGGGDSYFTDVAITKTGVVYASLSSNGSQAGLYRSTDGSTFTNITPAGFPSTYNRIKIGISPSNENQVYFLGNTPGAGMPDTNFQGSVEWNSLWRYTYISGDGSGAGGAWSDRSANLPSAGGIFEKYTCQGSYDIVVKVKPDDTNTVFIGGTNLYRSTSAFADNTHTIFIGGYQKGATLPVVNNYLNHHPDQHELVFFPSDPDKMISANDGGIFKTNGDTATTIVWTPLNNGYITTMFYTCAIDHASTNDIIIGGAQDNGSWFTNSAALTTPWITPRGGDGSYCAIADNGAAYYFSIQQGKMMRAKLNASGGIDSFARIDPIGATGYLFINPYIIDPNNNNIMYLIAGSDLWRNNNLAGIPYAGNWDSITTNWSKNSLGVSQLTAIAACKTPANRLYLGTYGRRVYRIENANTTPVKTEITSSLFPVTGGGASATVSCIAVDPNNGDHIIVAYSNYNVYSLFYSPDAGATWSKVAGNLEANSNGTGDGPSVRWASIIPVSDGTVYLVGTSVGLFATNSLDSQNTYWTQLGANTIGSSVVDMIDYRSTDGLVVVATHSHGIFSSHITSVNDVGVKRVAAYNIADLRNYPNPFKSQTIIQFNLKEKANVVLNVYDISGRLVSTLANSQMDAGEKKYIFSGNDLTPGIYYCSLQAGQTSQTLPIVLAK